MPISSMCPVSITRGFPFPFREATEFPCTSTRTSSANFPTSSRQTRPGACSNPDGPAVSRSFFKNAVVNGVIVVSLYCLLPAQAGAIQQEAENREHDEPKDGRGRKPAQLVIQRYGLGEPIRRLA